MKKFLTILIISLLTLPAFAFKLNAETLGDPNDLLTVVTPSPNQKVSGTINISWYMFDNNQNVIPYKLNLFDAATCRTTDFGQINSNTNGNSSTTQLNTYSWNTASTLSSSNLNDGNYCLRICLAMKNGSSDYSACNARYIRIINHNKPPVITSVPTNLIIKESDSWHYQIVATDPDNDSITYRLIQGASFLTINPQTGLVSTNSVSKKLPDGIVRSDYTIIVAADDNFAGAVSQQFTLSIIKDSSVGVPAPNPTPEPPSNQPTVIIFNEPKESQTFTDGDNKISWTISDNDGIDNITLNYSSDSVNWKEVTKFTKEPFPTEYKWDVKDITDGDYFLQLVVKDKLGNIVSRISRKFQIKNGQNEPEQTNNPLIINVRPANNSETQERRPIITGEFVPADGSEIVPESFQIKLNDREDLLDCQHDDKTFSCTPKEDLPFGENKVSASTQDKNGKKVTAEWVFTIKEGSVVSAPVSSPANGNDNIIIFGREIPRNIFNIILIICCIASLLILIPWILYLIWSGRRKEETTTTTTTYDYSTGDNTTNTLSPVDSSGYYTPENYNYTTPTTNTTTTTTTTETKPVENTEPTSLPSDATKPASNYTIDDYYSYVNPSSNTQPAPTETTTTTSTEEKKDNYVEPPETT